jgi:hypothetical protein
MSPQNDEAAPVIESVKESPDRSATSEATGVERDEMGGGFARGLLTGRFQFSAVHPFPAARVQQQTGEAASAVPNADWLEVSAACVEFSKRCLASARAAAGASGPDGVVIGKRDVFAEKLARIASETFGMEAMTLYAARIAQTGLPIEAAMTSVWATEHAREHGHETMRMRVARGDAPGAPASPDSQRPSEDLRLVVARAAWDRHWKVIGPVFDAQRSGKERFEAAQRAAWHYARWYPRQWLGPFADLGLLFSDLSPRLAAHVRWCAWASHRLSRALFHALALHGAKLEHEELLPGRLSDLATELFAISATCSYAQHLHTPESLELADFFGRATRLKIERLFRVLHHHTDRASERLAQSVLAERHVWLEGRERD